MAKQKKTVRPAIDLLVPGIQIIRQNLLTYFILLVLPLLLGNMTGTAPEMSSKPTTKELIDMLGSTFTPYVLVGSLLSLLFFAPLMYTQLRTASGQSVLLTTALHKGFKYFWRILGTAILTGGAILVGLVFLIIPGLIMFRRYVLAPYFLIDKDLSVLDAMRASAKASKPYAWSLYDILIVSTLFSLVSIFGVLGAIISTVLLVLYSPAFALRYHEIK